MQAVNIFDIPKPHIQNLFEIVIGHGCFDASATIMPADNHVLHFQVHYRIFQHTEQIYICMDNQIGNIPVNKYFSGLGSCNFIGRHAAVAASDP